MSLLNGEHFGINQLLENDGLSAFYRFALKQGVHDVGSSGMIYAECQFKAMQMIVGYRSTNEAKYDLRSIHLHAFGHCIWNPVVMGPLKSNNIENNIVRYAFTRDDGMGVAVVHLLKFDTLPSICRGDHLKMQMVAFPEFLGYYEDEKAYVQKEQDHFIIGDGAVAQVQTFYPAEPDYIYEGEEARLEDLLFIRGTVLESVAGYVGVKEVEEDYPFVKTTISTRFGPLDIIHSFDEVSEEQYELMKPGSIVAGVFKLQGKVLID